MKTTLQRFLLAVFVWSQLPHARAALPEILPPGHRPVPLGVHALTGARVVIRPGETIDGGTIVIRDGYIESVGKDAAIPAEARVWNLQGHTIYAGFIDPYLTSGTNSPPARSGGAEPELTSGHTRFFGVAGDEKDPGLPGAGHELAVVSPQVRMAERYVPDSKSLEQLRDLGFAAANVAPPKGIFRGTSALVLLRDDNPTGLIVKPDVFQHIVLEPESGREDAYPRSHMGVVAVVRQTIFDARTETNAARGNVFEPALAALQPLVHRQIPALIEPGSILMLDRAAHIARDLGIDFYLAGSGEEWRRPDLVKAAQTPIILPLQFPEVPKLPEDDDWINVSLDQLRAWDWASENPALLRRAGMEIAFTTHRLADRKVFRKNLTLALSRGLTEDDALAALTTIPAKLCGVSDKLGTIEKGRIANLTVVQGDSYFKTENQVREVWIGGRVERTTPVLEEPGKKPEKPEALRERLAHSPLEGRGPLSQPAAVLVKNATIWTSGPEGRLLNADLLVVNGKVKQTGRNLAAPPGAVVIDGQSKHVTPGLVDAHNHSMILGAVNEGTLPSTAMVRVEDVINSETRRLQEQLAGGLTTANLLHGSANPIGGQSCVIKLRDGAAPDALKLEGAPAGIKFALGENVKQSNWGDRRTTRFPQTRMGVRTFIANRFSAARQYLKQIDIAKRDGAPAPRRDLELEALGEILEGRRWIHCHSYRQDEILSFLRLMESFGVKVGTLQHVLEGYKLAPEIAAHGAGASTFSDWWGYKFEVYDAIPYNGSLMHERGVVVSFNSDSADLARRLNTEAAKAVKYGGTSEEEALKFVTANPARQLHLENRIGSLEAGKDGDFVIWSKSPLDSTTVCLETWIEGKQFFEREHAHAIAAELEKERNALLERARKSAAQRGAGAGGEPSKSTFFEVALEHWYDSTERHCDE